MCESNIIKRIPGQAPISPKEKQGYLEDLCKQSKIQLTELLERQKALLRNKGFIQRLPDKGDKISKFKSRIEAELVRRAEVDKTTALLERLNINGPVEEIEWTGSFSTAIQEKEQPLSDEEVVDDEIKAIRILASHGRTSKIIRVLKPPEKLITEKDLIEINPQTNPYAATLCKKVADWCSVPVKENFKPYRTIKSRDGNPSPKPKESPGKSLPDHHSTQDGGEKHDEKVSQLDTSLIAEEKKVPHIDMSLYVLEEEVHDGGDVAEKVESVEMVKRVRHWEITAATPPPPVHGQTLMINLEESLALEKASVEKTIAARSTQAMLRLTEQLQRESFTRYREASESSSDEEEKGEHEEQGDDDEEPEKDEAVVYSLVD